MAARLGNPAMSTFPSGGDAATLRLSISGIKGALDPSQKVVVTVDASCCRKLTSFDVCARITFARALGPELMTLVALK